MSGRRALERCLAVLEMLSRASNRLMLNVETKQASVKPDAFWEPNGGPRDVPFPFVATCLAIAASFDATEGYFHPIHIEPWSMSFDEGDNNDGTVSP